VNTRERSDFERVVDQHLVNLMSRPGVESVGIGWRRRRAARGVLHRTRDRGARVCRVKRSCRSLHLNIKHDG
jgi:hypothetical protein